MNRESPLEINTPEKKSVSELNESLERVFGELNRLGSEICDIGKMAMGEGGLDDFDNFLVKLDKIRGQYDENLELLEQLEAKLKDAMKEE